MSAMHLHEKLQAALGQQLSDHITSTIIKRGWQYYLNGHVQTVQATVHDTLTGVVRGADLYAVVMDAEHFRYSNCTCPYDGFCKHMAAVYFQYTSEQNGGEEAAEQAYFRLLGLAPASKLVRNGGGLNSLRAELPGTDHTAQQWLEWMNKEHGDVWKKCRHSLHLLQPVLSSLKGLARDWPKPLQRLHWATSIVFVLEQAERALASVDSFSQYYHEMSFGRMAEPWVEHLYTLISELTPNEMDDSQLNWVGALTSQVKNRALKKERQLFDWASIYLAVCEKFADYPNWLEKEQTAILAALQSEEAAGWNESFLYVAAGKMCFHEQADELAIEYFSKASFERSQKMIYPCAAKRMEEGEWEKAQLWMSFLFDRVHNSRSAWAVSPFMALCRQAEQSRPDLPIWTAYMTELLPHSYLDLSEHWLRQKRYEDWADLQMLIGARLETLSADELREVAKSAPRTLMPLYHQAIDASIQSRNRQGYRIAVKQLKKLERIYTAAKETDRWNVYITALIAKYQRLRAFQEELWKGKIVT